MGKENVAAYMYHIAFLASVSLLDKTLTGMVDRVNEIGFTINAKKIKLCKSYNRDKPLKNRTSFKPNEAVEEFKYLSTIKKINKYIK